MKRRSSLSFALTGGTWFVYLKGYNLSVATAVGFVALAGVAAELGVVVMLLHLKHATADYDLLCGAPHKSSINTWHFSIL
jgi:Cu/Ag efflux pump CusA